MNWRINLEIVKFNKSDDDIDGIAWIASLPASKKSDLFRHNHIEITEATEGSRLVSTDGAMMFVYETRDTIDNGYYEVLKATGSEVILHKFCEVGDDGDNYLFPDWIEKFSGSGVNVKWSGPVSSLDRITISKSFSDTVRNLPVKHSLVFELFTAALGGPGIVLSEVHNNNKVYVELSGGRCRAKVMTTIDTGRVKGEDE